MEHPLHKKIGISLKALEGRLKVVLDPACCDVPEQLIPLFMDEPKTNETEICNVDIMVIDKEKKRIHTIIEIDETSILPTKICGKFLTSALARFSEHKTYGKLLLHKTKFIQVLSDKALKEDVSSKKRQAKRIEQKIREMLPNFATISEYSIFWERDLDDTCSQIINVINAVNE